MSGRKKYPLDYNPIREYWEKSQSGEINVGQKVYKTYRHVIRQMDRKDNAYFYDPRRANHILEFFENFLHHSKGKCGGQLVKLELFEKAMLALRLSEGLDLNRYPEEAPLVLKRASLFDGTGLTEINNNVLRFTPEGFLVSNQLISEILADF